VKSLKDGKIEKLAIWYLLLNFSTNDNQEQKELSGTHSPSKLTRGEGYVGCSHVTEESAFAALRISKIEPLSDDELASISVALPSSIQEKFQEQLCLLLEHLPPLRLQKEACKICDLIFLHTLLPLYTNLKVKAERSFANHIDKVQGRR
jgi:hypothetical protein